MTEYRKKPVVVNAVQVSAADFNASLPIGRAWDGSPFDGDAHFLEPHFQKGSLTPHNRGGTDYAQWDIKTLEGTMNAQPGDWIIEGVNGEIYPCKPDIFEKTYEPVGNHTSDCATHSAPALPDGACDCGAEGGGITDK